MSCHVMSCHVMSCHVMSCYVMLNTLSKSIYIFSFIRKEGQPWWDVAIYSPRSRLGGLEIIHINALKRAAPPKRAKSS